ncbi:MAG: NAD-dependent epimerase/dehydratase family protein [Gemmataceae bacterium]|nr:NAD-dependent epimerase/dehydratase family protein [Gemmataceae bacterium]
MAKVLLTGASGFIGANLARLLLEAGEDVHIAVRPEANLWRLREITHRLSIHHADLLNVHSLRRVVAECRPNVVYHLAGYGVMAGQTERAAILASNVVGTGNLITALDEHDYERLVFAGSSAEYGPKSGPLLETDAPSPRNDYGVAKASATLLCQAAAWQGRPVCVVRIFTAYGPWEMPPRLVPYLLECWQRQQAPQLSSGRQKRDFIHVRDVCELLRVAGQHPDAAGRILHAATGNVHSIRELVETLRMIAGASQAPVFGALANRSGEPEDWSASNAETTRLTGWRPALDLESGLRQVWEWFHTQRFVYRQAS